MADVNDIKPTVPIHPIRPPARESEHGQDVEEVRRREQRRRRGGKPPPVQRREDDDDDDGTSDGHVDEYA